MARGVRSNPVLLPTFSPNLQPQSLASYDPKTRRNTILIAEIVPTINPGDSQPSAYIPADRYYVQLGGLESGSCLPSWTSSVSNVSFKNWDSSGSRFYARLSSAAALAYIGANQNARFIFPQGPFGVATSYAPKNVTVQAVWIRFCARFNANADYTTYGVGAVSSTNRFNTATDHFIQVGRNTGTWELGSCDGATISQASGGAADGGFHEFGVRWKFAEDLRLYVDDTLTITKTTNLPTEPLQLMIQAPDNTTTIDIVDYLVEWEAA